MQKVEAAIDDLISDLNRVNARIKGLGEHRSCSIAITKIEEAQLWLRHRARGVEGAQKA